MNTFCKSFVSFLGVVFVCMMSNTYADHQGHAHDENLLPATKSVASFGDVGCENVIVAEVNGLVCDFCARALEKVFGKRDGVTGVDVDLNNAEVTIALEAGKSIDDATLTKLINDSGYNVVRFQKGCS